MLTAEGGDGARCVPVLYDAGACVRTFERPPGARMRRGRVIGRVERVCRVTTRRVCAGPENLSDLRCEGSPQARSRRRYHIARAVTEEGRRAFPSVPHASHGSSRVAAPRPCASGVGVIRAGSRVHVQRAGNRTSAPPMKREGRGTPPPSRNARRPASGARVPARRRAVAGGCRRRQRRTSADVRRCLRLC